MPYENPVEHVMQAAVLMNGDPDPRWHAVARLLTEAVAYLRLPRWEEYPVAVKALAVADAYLEGVSCV